MPTESWVPFEYERSMNVYRPLVSINLKYGKKFNDRIVSLVDSGARDTVFDTAIANDLNVPLVQSNSVKIEMGGKKFVAYKSHVRL